MPFDIDSRSVAILGVGLLALSCWGAAAAGEPVDFEPSPVVRPVHTYSIVAIDPDTGDMGVAVQSHWFSVGPIVAWGEAGVGVVATQSLADPSYGPLGLELMRAGRTAEQALRGLLAADPASEVRQVAMLDRAGNVAVHTGPRCIAHAGHVVGDTFGVQANLMAEASVWPAMARAFRDADGDLAGRMLAALEAAEAEGGDIRGKQSVAMLVVSGTSTGRPWVDRKVDLRVEDHADPLGEMRRLLRLERAYDAMNRGDLALEHDDVEGALAAYAEAERLAPEQVEMRFWHAVSLANVGRVDAAREILDALHAIDPAWRTLLPRLVDAGLLAVDPDVLVRSGGADR
jgi:uncharacterized Ntn-hydrolase superfamily protein